MMPQEPYYTNRLAPKRRGRFSVFGMLIALVLIVGAIAFVKVLGRNHRPDPDDPSNWTNMPALGQPPDPDQVKNVAPGSKEDPDLEPVETFRRAAAIGLAARSGRVLAFDVTLTQKDVEHGLEAPAVIEEFRKEGISGVSVKLAKAGEGNVTIRYTDHGSRITVRGDVLAANGRPQFKALSGTKNGSAIEARVDGLLSRLPISLDSVQITDGTLLVDGKSRTPTPARLSSLSPPWPLVPR